VIERWLRRVVAGVGLWFGSVVVDVVAVDVVVVVDDVVVVVVGG